VLPSQRHVYAVSRRLRKSWTIVRVRDYIAKPKSSGYRALHLIVQRKGYAIEVQLRTIAQDVWANTVEQRGMTMGVGLKFGVGDADVHAMFVAMSDVLARFDRGELSSEELRAALETLP
jgi:putative GTP pyrophosphokinase